MLKHLLLAAFFGLFGLHVRAQNNAPIRHQLGYEMGFDLPVERMLSNGRNYVYFSPAYHHGLQYAFRPKSWLQLEVGVNYTIDYQSVLDFGWPNEQLYIPERKASLALKTRVNWLQGNRFEASSFVMVQPRFLNTFGRDLYLAIGSGVGYRYHDLLFKADVLAIPQLSVLRAASFVQPGLRFGVNYCF